MRCVVPPAIQAVPRLRIDVFSPQNVEVTLYCENDRSEPRSPEYSTKVLPCFSRLHYSRGYEGAMIEDVRAPGVCLFPYFTPASLHSTMFRFRCIALRTRTWTRTWTRERVQARVTRCEFVEIEIILIDSMFERNRRQRYRTVSTYRLLASVEVVSETSRHQKSRTHMEERCS